MLPPPFAKRLSIILCICWPSLACSLPTFPAGDAAGRKHGIVALDEAVHYPDFGIDSAATLFTLDGAVVTSGEEVLRRQHNVDNESVVDTSAAASDDLIFLSVKMPTHLQHQQQQQQQQQQQEQQPKYGAPNQHRQHNPGSHEIDLLTVIEDLSSSSSCSSSCESHGAGADAEAEDDTEAADADDAEDETVPREIELQIDDLRAPSAGRLAIDMRDFVALIPADEVKAIVATYYRHDPEVQRAYAYLSGRDFAALKQHIIAIPEMAAFLRYLNASGLDVVGFFHTLTNLTTQPDAPPNGDQDSVKNSTDSSEDLSDQVFNGWVESDGEQTNTTTTTTTTTTTRTPYKSSTILVSTTRNASVSLSIQDATTMITTASSPSLITTATTTTTATATTTTATTSASLNGLHGLVDSILDVLPQDQILTTFFDKLETDEQFSKLVDNVGSPDFANILHNMEHSPALRNLIFTLHNNGIYITRIADSLKAYFFLGTF